MELESIIKRREYCNNWNKTHRKRMSQVQRDWRKRHIDVIDKNHYKYCLKKYGIAVSTLQNRESQKHAVLSRQRWHLIDEIYLLTTNKTHKELAVELGRSIKSIERKLKRLKEEETK